MWRHGDLIIVAVDTIPAEATLSPTAILARGEATGHCHRIEDPRTAQAWELGNDAFVAVLAESATLVHEEHRPIRLPRGTYRFGRQREYSPEAIRRVVD